MARFYQHEGPEVRPTSGFGGSERRRYRDAMDATSKATPCGWHFLTHHSRVLVAVWKNPEIKLTALAAAVGVTPRATQHLVADLVRSGAITKVRVGRRNRYEVHCDAAVPDELGELTLGTLLERLSA
jgi:hypothetical protein